MNNKDIAIVGMSLYCPGADSINEFWYNLSHGVDSIIDAPPDRIDPAHFTDVDNSIDKFYCRKGGFSNPFKIDPLRYGILPVAAEGMDPEHLMMLGGVEHALYDAKVFHKKLSLKRGCVIIGKGNFSGLIALRSVDIIRTSSQIAQLIRNVLPNIPEREIDKIKKAYQAEQGRYQADTAIGTMPNLVASLIANKFDMQGPAYTVDAACASGLLAVDHSINLLRTGECDIAVAAGMHASQNAMFWSAFNMMGAMSRKQQISPFSEDADGLLIGQGGGIIVLKTLEKAIHDEDRIYAVIKETAVCSDGGGSHVMVTSVEGQKRVLEKAWKKSGMDPEKIGYVEAHGTATPIGDKTEISTLTEFFGDNTHPQAFVGSVKSNVGHTMPAAGMIGLIKTALALYHRKIPPTLHCEKPLKAMFKSRFLPPQQLIDWDPKKYPLIAGVNAFGFGGINSHAILTAYEDKTRRHVVKPINTFHKEAITVAAKSKDELLKKLRSGNFTVGEGTYRVAVFDPTDERIALACSVIERNTPWRGGNDIWYTNDPLLQNGEKLAFLFSGFDMAVDCETDSICDYLSIPRFIYDEGNRLGKQGVKQFYKMVINDYALKQLKIMPDLYAGVSIGEWYAVRAAGLLSDNSVRKMMDSLNLDGQDVDIHFINAGIGYDSIKSFCESNPNVCLSIDYSPNRILLAAKGDEAKDCLIKELDAREVSYFLLPFRSGFHTPFIKDKEAGTRELMANIEMRENLIPIWSSTSLSTYTSDKEDFINQVVDHLTTPLQFSKLISKLYEEENVRVFIQVGVGETIAFVDEILKGKNYGAISSASSERTAMEQIRRLMALLFVEGRDIDYNFLGVKILYQISRNLIKLPISTHIVDEFPLLKEAVGNYYGAAQRIPQYKEARHPVMQAMNANMQEMVTVQDEMMALFERSGLLNQDFSQSVLSNSNVPPQNNIINKPEKRAGTTFEEMLEITLDDHPYLIDHSVIRQPRGWDCREDLNPIVPMTMSLEIFAEIAHKYVPHRKILKIGPAMVTQWMSVEKPFRQKITGRWKTEDTVVLEMKNYATVEITFGDEYPSAPKEFEGPIDIGKEIMPPLTVEEVYDKYTFHGPDYHSCTKIHKIAERGIIGDCKKARGKGSLLDNIGQTLGLFLHLTETHNTISFPVRLKEISFYGDMYDQQGSFEQTLIVKSLTPNFSVGDFVIKRDGKIWAVVRNWVGQRFEFDLQIWHVILKPFQYMMSHELAPSVFYYDNAYSKNVSWMFLGKRYLNNLEKIHAESMTPNDQKSYLISRIALKDAVRSKIDREGEYRYPIEISVGYHENGKPYVYGSAGLDKVEVSLAHKDLEAVAIASDKPVGIDIEKIEKRDNSFIKASFTLKELNLIGENYSDEWLTRFWVAKEAFGKMTGRGLRGNPKQYEVEEIVGETLFIQGVGITTIKHKENYIVGWTN